MNKKFLITGIIFISILSIYLISSKGGFGFKKHTLNQNQCKNIVESGICDTLDNSGTGYCNRGDCYIRKSLMEENRGFLGNH
ncbi:MAG: hypothetical protein PHZ26_00490 [Candidatus Gracilibacteria bacterium]|nr:hypothetical protein [Candidatus Gracilibacteria bacterium]MDD2908215.1 hypothetical protein [Candidatus Gracilibacteria bacterium]